jgi:glycosyltransferase involved in cell wall biosynthesis
VPRISIVTPTYNQASTIRETIDSVLGQDYPDLELWVFDAGSRDGTLEILREYEADPRFHWVSEPDRGQSDAINKGLARCTGAIFNWLNSDDYLEPGALRIVAGCFEKNRELDIVSGTTAEFWGDPPKISNHLRLQMRASAEATIPVGIFCQPGTFWRTEIVRALGGIDPSLHCVLDWNLWVRYLARYGQDRVLRRDELLARFRQHLAAKTSLDSSKFYEETRIVFHNLHLTLRAPQPFLMPDVEKNPAWVRNEFQLGPAFDRERYLGCYAERMVRVHRKSEPALAKVWLRQAIAFKPWITPWRIKMALRLLFRK